MKRKKKSWLFLVALLAAAGAAQAVGVEVVKNAPLHLHVSHRWFFAIQHPPGHPNHAHLDDPRMLLQRSQGRGMRTLGFGP